MGWGGGGGGLCCKELGVCDCTVLYCNFWNLASFAGAYSEWLKCHPDHLRSVLPVLLGGLSQEHLASASTQALRGICEECVQDLEPGTLMEILSHCQVIS